MKILIVKTSAIGDVTHTLPALSALRRRYPEAHITWLVEEAAADILRGHPDLDRVLVSRRKSWVKELCGSGRGSTVREVWRFIRRLRDTEYDLIIDFQNLLKSGILVALARGARKIGYGRGMEHSEFSYIFLSERIRAVDMNLHAVRRELMLLESIGVPVRDISFPLPVGRPEREAALRLLGRHGIREEDAFRVAINPMAQWDTKLWSEKKFAALADRIIDAFGATPVFTGSEADRPAIARIIRGMRGPAVNLAGETTLRMLAALYAEVHVVVSTDTGPMHLAAAVGTPVVALFGPTAPWRTGPFGEGNRIVRAEIGCSPCFKRKCPANECMARIGVDRVFSEIGRIAPEGGGAC